MVKGEDRGPLKILHIDPERQWGGGEGQVMGLLGYLALRGHQNRLACDPRGRLKLEAEKNGIATCPVAMRSDIDLRAVLSLRRLIEREGCDIVHFHTKRALALSPWLGRLHPGLRYVVTRRMDYPVRRGWYDRYLYNRKVDGVIAISQKIADLLVEGGVRREKIRVIHSGIDPELFASAWGERKRQGPPVIGTVAVLEERKGHRFLLEAAALLKQEGHRLLYRFAGDGSQREYLKETAIGLGLKEEIAFEGFVSEISNFLSAVDVFVLPSLYEGLGVAVLEAMAAGRPVVATRAGGLPELVEDRVTGFLVPPGDSGGLARAIAQLVSREGLAREMGLSARERVQRHFTVGRMAKKNEDYYYELLGDPKRPALGQMR